MSTLCDWPCAGGAGECTGRVWKGAGVSEEPCGYEPANPYGCLYIIYNLYDR